MSTATDQDAATLVDRFTLKALVESCLVLEEGVASMKDIDLGMMAGAGIIPPPFARADQIGLDEVLAKLERAAREWGENFEPPTILRRLVAQGRLGVKTGQGFFPYARPDAGWDESPVKLETRDEVRDRLARPPAGQLDLARGRRGAAEGVGRGQGRAAGAGVRLGQPDAVLRRRRHQGVHDDGRGGRQGAARPDARAAARDGDARASSRSRRSTRSRSAAAASWRWPATSGSPPSRPRFGQPEINLGIIPGFGGTQRLPRLVGEAKALEMNLTGDPIGADEAYELGLATRVVPDHELLDTALAWARKLAGQAPLAVEQIKTVSAAGDLDAGIEAEKQGFATVFGSEDAQEGIAAFLGKRTPRFQGK